METHSNCTYDNYARDLVNVQQQFIFHHKLRPNVHTLAEQLNFSAVTSMSDTVDENEDLEIPIIDFITIDDYSFELLIPAPIDCWLTLDMLRRGTDKEVVICMSNNIKRNIIFSIHGCFLSFVDNKSFLYIPSSIEKKAYKDISSYELTNLISEISRHEAYQRIHIPQSLDSIGQMLYNNLRKFKISKDHRPMYKNKCKDAVLVTPLVCIKLMYDPTPDNTEANEIYEEPEKRINIQVVGFVSNPTQ